MKLKKFHWTRILLAAVIVFFYIPIIYTVVFSFNSTRSLTTFSGLTSSWYQYLRPSTYIFKSNSVLWLRASGCMRKG